MFETNRVIEGRQTELGPITGWIHMADQFHVRSLSAGQKEESRKRLRQIKDTRRWFGRALTGLGSIMQSGGNIDSADLECVGEMILEFSHVIHQLQDMDEHLFNSLKTERNLGPGEPSDPGPSYTGELW